MKHICIHKFKRGKNGKIILSLPDTSHLGPLLQAKYDELTGVNREKQYDVTKDTTTSKELLIMDFNKNASYIKKVVNVWIMKTSPHHYRQFEDLYNEAVIAFIECQAGYNPEMPWKPWLKRSIMNRLNNYIKSEVRFNNLRSELRENPLGYEDVVELRVSHEKSERTNVTRYRTSEEHKMFDDTMMSLVDSCPSITANEAFLIHCYLRHDGSGSKVATTLKIGRTTVWRTINRVVEKLQQHVKEV